ncbi:MAG: SRPBCC family protein [Acidimicrobiia bacterium]
MTEPILVERHVQAPPSAVYEYLVDPTLVATWFGESCSLDGTPGGDFAMLSPNGMTASGEVVEVVDGRKISFTWGWNGHPGVPPGSTLVEIELIADGEGTLVRLTHSELDLDEQPIHRTGWVHYLARLATAATGDNPGPDPGAA